MSEATSTWRMDVDVRGTINLLLPRQHSGRLIHIGATEMMWPILRQLRFKKIQFREYRSVGHRRFVEHPEP